VNALEKEVCFYPEMVILFEVIDPVCNSICRNLGRISGMSRVSGACRFDGQMRLRARRMEVTVEGDRLLV
jgi:hypothetical protein